MDYYVAFIAMCKRAAGLDLSEEEGKTDDRLLSTLSKFQKVLTFPTFVKPYNIYATVENL